MMDKWKVEIRFNGRLSGANQVRGEVVEAIGPHAAIDEVERMIIGDEGAFIYRGFTVDEVVE